MLVSVVETNILLGSVAFVVSSSLARLSNSTANNYIIIVPFIIECTEENITTELCEVGQHGSAGYNILPIPPLSRSRLGMGSWVCIHITGGCACFQIKIEGTQENFWLPIQLVDTYN